MTRAAPMTPEAAEIDRDLAAAGYGIALLKKEAATILRTSTRTVDRLIACKRLRAWRGADAGSSRVLIPRRAVAELLAGGG
jgi:excisionase family DNA binding protein